MAHGRSHVFHGDLGQQGLELLHGSTAHEAALFLRGDLGQPGEFGLFRFTADQKKEHEAQCCCDRVTCDPQGILTLHSHH
jgi:hypothetical protein